MNKTLKELINYDDHNPITGDDIIRATGGEVNIVMHDDLRPSDDIWNLFINKYSDNCACVIFYKIDGTDIGHFVTITYNRSADAIEYFDPIGNIPDFYSAGNKSLTLMLNVAGVKVNINRHRLQKADGVDDACGRYSIVRTWFRDLPLDRFVQLINGKLLLQNASDVVVIMTLGLI